MMKLYFGHPGDQPDYHAYEALQIFGDPGYMPELVPDQASTWIRAEIDGGETVNVEVPVIENSRELERYIYVKMSELTGYASPWGCMTGVRPTKIVNRLLDEGKSSEEVMNELTGYYLASSKKARLALDTAVFQKPFLDEQKADPSRIGIYIGIPFCPTRCVYCSFTSNPIKKYEKSVDAYLELLGREAEATADIVRENGLRIESVYVGGGTPTSLSEEQFTRLMNCIVRNFTSKSDCLREFSVEAGRPDSITAGKLDAMKNAGVTRISINPQSMNEETLRRIGRMHTPDDTLRAFSLARDKGFDNINTDIICGLPGENASMFSHTLDVLGVMTPESVTVHTLSVKRAADLKHDEMRSILRSDAAAEMVETAGTVLSGRGLRPYYMYRQKNMLGNHENVAYCLPGFESPYNIHIMEEDQTILALGAGSVSKRVTPGVIKRVFNVKSVEEYLLRSEEMAERKRNIFKNS